MSDPLQDALKRVQNKQPEPLTLKERAGMWLIGPGGWAMRQGMKLVTNTSASLSAWLTAQGLADERVTAISLGFVAVSSWLLELGLSHIAAKLARKAEPID